MMGAAKQHSIHMRNVQIAGKTRREVLDSPISGLGRICKGAG